MVGSRVTSSLARLALLAASLLLCLVAADLVLRVVFDPVDFLMPTLVADPVLGHRIAEGSGSHDAWGFRNREVPQRVDVVAIGDSQTYGVSAMAFASWPSWLAQLADVSVYNMALGGYGPIQYEYLLEHQALSLDPSVVLIGLYMGNDLVDAHRFVYSLDAWQQLRVEGLPAIEPGRVGVWEGASDHFRAFLARNSMLYRLTVTAFGQLLGKLEMKLAPPEVKITLVDDADLQTGFTPVDRLSALDTRRPEIVEGLRLGLDALGRIANVCDAAGVRLIVVLIPTKETVFERWLRGREELAHAAEIEELLDFEAQVRGEIERFLDGRGIEWVDPREAMLRAALLGPIYPSNTGGHPVSAGYRAIAEAVAEKLGERGAPRGAAVR